MTVADVGGSAARKFSDAGGIVLVREFACGIVVDAPFRHCTANDNANPSSCQPPESTFIFTQSGNLARTLLSARIALTAFKGYLSASGGGSQGFGGEFALCDSLKRITRTTVPREFA